MVGKNLSNSFLAGYNNRQEEIPMETDTSFTSAVVRIKVVGVGGGGNNIITQLGREIGRASCRERV